MPDDEPQMVDNREFRADLFYRLSVFPIELPPLRERPEDIRLLVHHFAMDYAARMRKRITAIQEEFMTALVRHSWPGNVRELQNFIERSVILSTGGVLSGSPPEVAGTSNGGTFPRWRADGKELAYFDTPDFALTIVSVRASAGWNHVRQAGVTLPDTLRFI